MRLLHLCALPVSLPSAHTCGCVLSDENTLFAWLLAQHDVSGTDIEIRLNVIILPYTIT